MTDNKDVLLELKKPRTLRNREGSHCPFVCCGIYF